MTICPICGSTEFDIHEGLFYCCECHTQIKETREEKDETEIESVYSGRSGKTSASETDKSSGEESKAPPKPWVTAEGYNLIIAKQVSTLIELGASPELKNAVFYIWALYLQKCEIAFRNDYRADDKIPTLGVFPSTRDIQIMSGMKKIISRSRVKRKCNEEDKEVVENVAKLDDIEDKAKNGDAEDEKNNDAEEGTLEGDDNANKPTTSFKTVRKSRCVKPAEMEDNMSSESLSDAAQSSSEDESIYRTMVSPKYMYSSHARKFKKTVGKRKAKYKRDSVSKSRYPHRMVISKTLCFCYLGLLYVEDQLLLSDIIRFVKERRVVYMNAYNFLSHFLQLQVFDYNVFTPATIPDMKRISAWCGHLIQFLSLPKFKHRPLLPIAARFVKDFNLPDELIPKIKILLKNFGKRDLLYESKKIGIVVSTKIPLYEVQAASYIIIALKMLFTLDGKTEKRHSEIVCEINKIKSDAQLFVWDDWVQFWKLKEACLKTEPFGRSEVSKIDLLDVNNFAEHCFSIREQPSGSGLGKSRKNDQSMRNVMKNILSTVNPEREALYNPPTSFPLRSQIRSFKMNASILHPFSQTENHDFFTGEDFSSHSLAYVPQKHHKLNNSKLEMLYLKLNTNIYERHNFTDCGESDSDSESEGLVCNSRYWHVNSSPKDISSNIETMPDTFKWMLNFVSKAIETDSVELYQEILKIEREIIHLLPKKKSIFV